MEIALIWIAIAVFTGVVASSKKRSGIGWFLIGLVFSLLALIAVGLMGPPDELNRTNAKTCPKCAEKVRVEAVTCRHCGHEFSAAEMQEAAEDAERIRRFSNWLPFGLLAALLIGVIAIAG